MAACGGILGGVLGGLNSGFSPLFAISLGLLAGAIGFGLMRYRIRNSVKVDSIPASRHERIDRVPRLLHIPPSGRACEFASPHFIPLFGAN